MTEVELKNLCDEWQALLGLAHWSIDVRVVRGAEIGNNRGQIDYTPVSEAAVIRLKDPMDYHGFFPCDLEEKIVHELLHLIFDNTAAEEDAYEQVLDRMARVMLKLKRQAGERRNGMIAK
nr:MAG TPA: WLM domain protein [Caudoviricetes sp.]